MNKKKVSLLILFVLLAFIGTGQFGFGGCQCPTIPILTYEYKIPYFTANNFTANNIDLTNLNDVDRIALFCYVEVEYYDAQGNALVGSTERRYLAELIRGETVFGEEVNMPPSLDAVNNFKLDAMQLNIPSNAVKAKVKFHVGAHYLLNDLTSDHYDDDDGIEAYARNFSLGFNKLTGWTKIEEDTEDVHYFEAEIMQGETLHGKFIGGHQFDTDQGYVTFSAEVALK
ncbi:hypothetical protein H5T89_06185 [bacterium]|nr:hypothetical protein [bacterium]